VVYSDDVAASGFDLHGVADGLVLVGCAANTMHGVSCVMRAIVPCLSSPPLNPSAWM